ncbi:MAG: 23S rRNA (guanosine(2251)-2'-O)-methyltransferase RlmB, partial [Patescibacteria group bacterium]
AKPDFHKKRESLSRRGILLWGLHAVREAWLNPKRKCYRLWATEAGLAALKETLPEATEKGLQRPLPLPASKADIEHFLPRESVHQGVALEAEPLVEISLDELLGRENVPDLVIILDQVTDPHNVGAILRSAAAFGAGAVIVTERGAPNATGVMAKTASGAAEHVPLIHIVNIARAIEVLQAEDFWCIGLAEEGAKVLDETVLGSGRIALVLGAEGDGLRRLTRERCDELARLPTKGPIGSLNVSNAAAVALFEVRRQKRTGG